MFRKARSHSLAYKIQKFMKTRDRCVDTTVEIQEGDGDEQVWAAHIDAFSRFLVNNLNENKLKTLLKSLESKGGINTDCIIVPTEYDVAKKLGLSNSKTRPDVLFCKVLRWPEVESKSELKTLISCQNYGGTLSCANPFHYSKITSKGKRGFLQDFVGM